MKKHGFILVILAVCLIFSACGGGDEESENGKEALEISDGETQEATATDMTRSDGLLMPSSDEYTVTPTADLSGTRDVAPDLYCGYSEFVGPGVYCLYAMDEDTSYEYHEDDGYIPEAGDLLITGDENDEYLFDPDDVELTGLRAIPYYHETEVWNGHILYVASVDAAGNMICYEGNAIAPNQDLDEDDENYIYKSSVDCIVINYYTGRILTEGKTSEKTIRAVIETNFTDEGTENVNAAAARSLEAFAQDAEALREEIMSLYPYEGINWCGLYIHYILIDAGLNYEDEESEEGDSGNYWDENPDGWPQGVPEGPGGRREDW